MTDWAIRPAILDDANELSAMEKAIFGDKSWGDNAIAEGLTAPFVYGLVADDQKGVPVGFGLWRHLLDEAEILTIGVMDEHQRRGVGKALLAAIVRDAMANEAKRLFLEVSTANEKALCLYRESGFAPIGERKGYYPDGSDAIVMRLHLAPDSA